MSNDEMAYFILKCEHHFLENIADCDIHYYSGVIDFVDHLLCKIGESDEAHD